ncbi:MAG: bifunctional precorrin-2 dehydrogenase/sirohydrochlorin ferrochelatase [Bacteroidota bacterium]
MNIKMASIESLNNKIAINKLFPIFLKLESLQLTIVGGGYVGFEKLNAVLQNSPDTAIKLVAKEISSQIRELAAGYPNIILIEKPYESNDIEETADIVIAAVNDPVLSAQVHADAKAKRKLVNVADKPALCDFYLSSVVQKGSVKIAISTNGKSPTVAKRLKEVLAGLLPDEMESMLDNIHLIRETLKGDFEEKVKQLNDLTKGLINKNA